MRSIPAGESPLFQDSRGGGTTHADPDPRPGSLAFPRPRDLGGRPDRTLLPAPRYAWGDYDGDGLADLYVTNGAGADHLYRNRGDGGFGDVTAGALLPHATSRLALWRDSDGDGALDLLTIDASGRVHLHQNLGNGAFHDITEASGLDPELEAVDATWTDYDRDSRPDLVLATPEGDVLYHNLSWGLFTRVEPGTRAAGSPARAVASSQGTGAPIIVVAGPWSPAPKREGNPLPATKEAPPHRPGQGDVPALRPATGDGGGAAAAAPAAPAGGGSIGGAGFPSRAPASAPGSSSRTADAGPHCATALDDQSSPGCVQASSIPSLGKLYPLSSDLFVDPTGKVGMGTTAPTHKLHVIDAGSGSALRIDGPGTSGSLGQLDFGDLSRVYLKGDATDSLEIHADGRVAFTNTMVGVGTTNPTHMLHVNSFLMPEALRLEGPGAFGSQAKLNFGDNDFSSLQEDVDDALLIHANARIALTGGSVGVGTTSPAHALDVVGDTGTSGSHFVGTLGSILHQGSTGQIGAANGWVPNTGNPTGGLWVEATDGVEGGGFYADGDMAAIWSPGDSDILWVYDEDDLPSGSPVFAIDGLGNARLGTSTAGSVRLNVVNSTTLGSPGATISASNQGTGAAPALFTESWGTDPVAVVSQHGTGPLLRGYNATSANVFEVTQTGRVVTTALQITGGGDLVEGFDAGEALASGTVVVIDADRAGALRASTAPYDRRVAGVVSGAGGIEHGIRMGQDGALDGDTLVALTGRVYVRCSAENGPIAPGDLLTTASVEGCAMRASDPERSFGAVLGKAMGSLEEGTGLVLVLVNLQ